MRCVTSFLVLCILMFLVLNNVKAVDVKAQKKERLKPLCKITGWATPVKCPASVRDASDMCYRSMHSRDRTYKRCDCNNIKLRGKDAHQCTCYMKLPCNQP
ncbi:hypothetical protein CARUB_v10015784mg [Capsella rubella]|uniref:Uncharacterized protein n=1 Tax=Capsella rubella TaxID=81985 RepID=R0I7S7_9BRAS|nr:putative defensin-like protein 252 [Capsella rubella]EOA32503.1 hypothetical protein CARUB_v10015784mg [Capsella rubella]